MLHFLRGLAALLLLAGVASAGQILNPQDDDVFPPRNMRNYHVELECTSGGFTTAGTGDVISAVTGSGASVGGLSSGNLNAFAGLCDLQTGTTTTGAAAVWTATGNVLNFGNGTVRFFASIAEGTVSDATDNYTIRLGLMDVASGEATDGCYWRHNYNVNGGEWQGVAISNGVETAIDTNITFSGSQAVKNFGVRVTGGTACAFFKDGVEVSNSPITSNVPTGSSRLTGWGVQVLKSAGTTSRHLYIDAVAVQQIPSTPRSGWIVP